MRSMYCPMRYDGNIPALQPSMQSNAQSRTERSQLDASGRGNAAAIGSHFAWSILTRTCDFAFYFSLELYC